MRPRHLEVEAFGPFGSTVKIDFDEVGVDGLFLIHGRTGAGKTSLLDAVSFALYGEVPGARRSRPLRSHHAGPDAAPFVRLEFDAQGGSYCVQRTAAWEAPKKRGTGTTTKPPTASLHRTDGGRNELISNRNTEVTSEVQQLIGLSAAQFQQVILLPQGKFEKVLQADSKERERLFETLFDTAHYKVAEQWLDTEAKQRREQVAKRRDALVSLIGEATRRAADVLASVAVGSGPSPGAAVLDLTDGGSADQLAVDPTDPTVTAHLLERLALAQQTVTADLTAASSSLTRVRAQLDGARNIAERVARRAALAQQAEKLLALQGEIDAVRAVVAAADEAERLRPSLEEEQRCTDVVNKVQQTVSADLLAAAEAVKLLPVPLAEVDALDLASVPPQTALDRATRAVEVSHTNLVSLRRQAADRDAAVKKRQQTRERAAQARTLHDGARNRIEMDQERLPEVEALLVRARQAAAAEPGLGKAAAEAQARAEAAAQMEALAPVLTAAVDRHAEARQRALDAQAMKNSLMAKYLEGIAANLAGRLELDEACFVCGSHDHPDPAEPAGDAVSDAHIDRADEVVAVAVEEQTKQQDALQEVQRRHAVLQVQLGGDAPDVAAAREAADAAHKAHRDALKLAERVSELETAQKQLNLAISAQREVAETAAAAVSAAEAETALLDAEIQRAEVAVAEGLGAATDLEGAITRADVLLTALCRVAEHAAGTDDARSKLEQARRRATAEVEASPFADAAQAMAAQRPESERTELHQQIRRHETQVATVASRLSDPEFADLPDDPPDTADLEATVGAAEQLHEALLQKASITGNALTAVQRLAGEHQELAREFRAARAEADLFQGVADRCNGRSQPKVPLQRWVLATYLHEVCQHANRRLATMTGGRYQLRVERIGARANAPAGLDLRVHDANTNQEREVSSLSGGETFQASLALALGVADSVEAHTGGVRLDTLFVDEGFGTLDPDSLELAMDELDGLRAGGRMVGVISHVATLRERIRMGIEVTPTPAGSKVQVGAVPAS